MNKKTCNLVGLLSLVVILIASFLFVQGEWLWAKANEEHIEAGTSLEEKLKEVLDNEYLDGTVTGVSIRHGDTGEVLFSQDGDIRLHPASNMKLFTAVAALETLGEDYRFRTEVLTDGKKKGDVLHGNLYLKGKGDPTLLREDLQQFAKELKEQGITKFKGDLIGDDTWYDDERLSQDLNWSDEPFYTGAQVSALTLSPDNDYDAGTIIVEVTPTDKTGEKASVSMRPETEYVVIENNTTMVAAGEEKKISIERQHGNNKIMVEGKMPLGGTLTRSWSSVWEPTGYVIDVFKQTLGEEGVEFIGKFKVKSEPAPKDAQVVAFKESMPLEELLIPFMKLSNNGHGEVLTKEMGKVLFEEGSWEKGLEVIEKSVRDFGVRADTVQFRDGSGMSHKTVIPANDITQMLFEVQEASWFSVFKHSLPIAGETDRLIGGTLRNRLTGEFTKGNVTAKTGSISGVSSLSGYVKAKDGTDLIFSIMINNYLGEGRNIRAVEDAIANTLAEHEFQTKQ
ncbi:D-alanyl-D-alanine carboxypeptidase/D-alanyl-D-alanine endopeptidase [Shouchella patagoniensis]|uniref:D-alanyl-D-alanine carboxypeptidase/D-alanyl-D-alanine endopeptidase n=1 Tax=Shouchella patagoniensis TaxID=228576 RepID=UPI001FE92445|nr:D-alanyl-D-alanine carboxypeptidase/D-alanyl-D-alanine-endopeptidase [Shouchella patagoniensis]